MGLTKEEAAKILDVNVDDDPDAIKKVPESSRSSCTPTKTATTPRRRRSSSAREAHKCLTDPNYGGRDGNERRRT